MTLRFLVVDAGEHGFTFVAVSRGETLLRGIAHPTREAARRAAEAARDAISGVEVRRRADGYHQLVLHAVGVFATSPPVAHEGVVVQQREHVVRLAPSAPIEDVHPRIPSVVRPPAVVEQVRSRLAGAAPSRSTVVWVDQGDEVAVHVDSVEIAVRDGLIGVSVDLESDQTGRGPVTVVFAVGTDGHPAATASAPGGNPALAARWGEAVRSTAWSAIQDLALEHGAERGGDPSGIIAANGAIGLRLRHPAWVPSE